MTSQLEQGIDVMEERKRNLDQPEHSEEHAREPQRDDGDQHAGWNLVPLGRSGMGMPGVIALHIEGFKDPSKIDQVQQ
jgi:hypothetical protein